MSADNRLVRVELVKIVIRESSEQQFIFLREKEGGRSFPIVIGIFEALAIDRRVRGIETPRPMTHDLLASAIEALGGRVLRVVVTKLEENTFFARLHLERDGQELTLDCRPSDAIALAVQLDAAIFVAEDVIDAVAGG